MVGRVHWYCVEHHFKGVESVKTIGQIGLTVFGAMMLVAAGLAWVAIVYVLAGVALLRYAAIKLQGGDAH